jgi:hypothetical protein
MTHKADIALIGNPSGFELGSKYSEGRGIHVDAQAFGAILATELDTSIDYIFNIEKSLKLQEERRKLIIMGLAIPPGMNSLDEETDNLVAKVFSTNQPHPYWALGAHLIERIRVSGSANQETPIAVLTNYDLNKPFGNHPTIPSSPSAQITAHEFIDLIAGKNSTCLHVSSLDLDGLVEGLKQYYAYASTLE